jgi:hypothetical protein
MLERAGDGLPVVASDTRAVLSQLAVTTRAIGAERGAPHFYLMLEWAVDELAGRRVP